MTVRSHAGSAGRTRPPPYNSAANFRGSTLQHFAGQMREPTAGSASGILAKGLAVMAEGRPALRVLLAVPAVGAHLHTEESTPKIHCRQSLSALADNSCLTALMRFFH